ncbi:hypothetical protein ES705_43449 [subsurface metagenome]
MNPIDLGKAISEHGIPVITALMLILAIGLVWYLIKRQSKREEKFDTERAKREVRHDKQQDEDRKFSRDIIINGLEGIHKMSLKNTELSIQGITLQKEMIKGLRGHNKYTKNTAKKMLESFSAVCDKLNGKTSTEVGKKNGQKR